jgi:hypothetical protein
MSVGVGARLSIGWTHMRQFYKSQELFISLLTHTAIHGRQKSNVILHTPNQMRRLQQSTESRLKDREIKN